MTNQELIREFKNGRTRGIAGHLYIKDNKLINYKTTIAYRDENGKFHLNSRHYTASTSTIQNYCRYILDPIEEYIGEDFIKLDPGVKTIKAGEVY